VRNRRFNTNLCNCYPQSPSRIRDRQLMGPARVKALNANCWGLPVIGYAMRVVSLYSLRTRKVSAAQTASASSGVIRNHRTAIPFSSVANCNHKNYVHALSIAVRKAALTSRRPRPQRTTLNPFLTWTGRPRLRRAQRAQTIAPRSKTKNSNR
jgi:hypothetical protein